MVQYLCVQQKPTSPKNKNTAALIAKVEREGRPSYPQGFPRHTLTGCIAITNPRLTIVRLGITLHSALLYFLQLTCSKIHLGVHACILQLYLFLITCIFKGHKMHNGCLGVVWCQLLTGTFLSFCILYFCMKVGRPVRSTNVKKTLPATKTMSDTTTVPVHSWLDYTES